MLPLRHLPPLPLPHGPTPRRLLATAASASALPWPGLHAWRRLHLAASNLRSWGPHGPASRTPTRRACPKPALGAGNGSSLAEMGALVLSTADPLATARVTHATFSWWAGGLPVGLAQAPDHPARTDKPVVVTQKEITTQKEMGVPLNAYMLHNLAHVELNAIDLAWDTVVQFSALRDTLGDGFFADFAGVADDKSRHFRWYSQRLAELGFSYGDMPVHNLLWRECAKSSSDVSARLAVIPLVQVHNRLACIVEMEKENANLNS